MKFLHLSLLVLALSGLSSAIAAQSSTHQSDGLMTWSDLTNRPRPKATATIAYGTDPMQKIDLWLPGGQGPFPVVLMVHGGCWLTRVADRSLMDWVAEDLRTHGIAVWNIDYRGIDIAGGGYPGTFQDVAAAADKLAADAGKYHLDLKRLVAVGHSAGGHLALWLSARPRLPADSVLYSVHPLPIQHVVSLGGLPDLEATAESPDNGCGTKGIAGLVGAPSAAHADVFADTSVTRLLPLGVEQILINGGYDRIIPGRLGLDFFKKAQAAGDKVTLSFVSKTGHVELITPDSKAWTQARGFIQMALEK
ncbi:MAG: alpha/beta hydrolase [Sphingobium sp.]